MFKNKTVLLAQVAFTTDHECHSNASLHSKRFCGVWEQRKTEERDIWYLTCTENWGKSQKKKDGGRNIQYSLAPFILLPNRTEMLAMQATAMQVD